MRTSKQAATEYVGEFYPPDVLTLYNAMDAFLEGNEDRFVAWLAARLKDYAIEVATECEGKLSEVRTALKYEPEDVC